MISRSEAAYIATSFQPGPEEDAPAIRADGRSAFAYRPISLALGVAPQANGSARCAIGGTDVLVGCKLEVSEGSRRLACSVECSPGALNTLPSDPSQELTDFLSSLLHPLRASPQLFISPRQHWCLFVDAVVVSADGGNLYDTIAMAARMAVGDVLIPRTRPAVYQAPKDAPSAGAEDAEAAGIKGLLRGQKGRRTNDAKAVDFELLDREAGQGMTWQNRESIPVVVTLNLLDQRPFLDATLAEEQVASSRLVLGFSANGKQLSHVSQLGRAEVESDRLFPLIRQASGIAASLQKTLDAKWADPGASAGGVMLGAFGNTTW